MRPILFYIGSLPVRAYGTMMIVGFLLGLWRASRICKRYKITPEQVMDACVLVLLSGIVGARLLFLLLTVPKEGWGVFSSVFRIWEGGLSFHGGLIGAIIAIAIYIRVKRIRFFDIADLLAPSLAIAYAFARIGCFLNGCCYGVATMLPWAVRFHDPVTGELTAPSHPAQLYAFAINLVIFGILTRIERLKPARGVIFFSYLVLYSTYRFIIEFIRKGVTAQVMFAGLTQAQVASLAAIIVFGLALLAIRRRPKLDNERAGV